MVNLVWDSQKTAAAISEKGAYRAENGGTLFMGTQNRTALPSSPSSRVQAQRTDGRPFLYLSVTLIKAINSRCNLFDRWGQVLAVVDGPAGSPVIFLVGTLSSRLVRVTH